LYYDDYTKEEKEHDEDDDDDNLTYNSDISEVIIDYYIDNTDSQNNTEINN